MGVVASVLSALMLLLILEKLSRDFTLENLLFEAGLIIRFAKTRLEFFLVKRPRR